MPDDPRDSLPAAAQPGRGPAWRSAAFELEAFEGIRLGDEQAFRTIAEPLQPILRDLAGLYVRADAVDALVRRTWEVTLGGLELFSWRTPLATWVAGTTVEVGRARARHLTARERPRSPDAVLPASEVPGPPDWSDLPWGARWVQAPGTLADGLAALPLGQREVLHGRDAEQWSSRRVCDVFGLTEQAHDRLLAEAHSRLHAALTTLVGQGDPDDRAEQIAALARWIHEWHEVPASDPLDPETAAVFHRWAAGRGSGWRRFSLRSLSRTA